MSTILNINKLEKNLRTEAKRFVGEGMRVKKTNAQFYNQVTLLTGLHIGPESRPKELRAANDLIDEHLMKERKRAKSGRMDYSLDRHLALHQVQGLLKSQQALCE